MEVAIAPARRPHRTSARDALPTRRPRRITRQTVVHALVVLLALVPAAWAVYGVLSDVFLGTRHFGSNPIKAVEHFTGDWTLRFLALTLAVTPARRITGWNWLARYRRTFGLLAFTYVSLHLLTYAVLDVELSWGDLVADVIKRPYITIGMAGFLLFIPLAVTSTRGWIRRLGRRWTVLHRAVYIIVVLGTIHFWMSVKKDITDPLAFATIFGALLAWRAFTAWNGSRPSALGSRLSALGRAPLDRPRREPRAERSERSEPSATRATREV